jgi:hypothetical protein
MPTTSDVETMSDAERKRNAAAVMTKTGARRSGGGKRRPRIASTRPGIFSNTFHSIACQTGGSCGIGPIKRTNIMASRLNLGTDEWVGRNVIVKDVTTRLKKFSASPFEVESDTFSIYTVVEAKEFPNRCELHVVEWDGVHPAPAKEHDFQKAPGAIEGWVKEDEIVPFDQDLAQFAQFPRTSPHSKWPYSHVIRLTGDKKHYLIRLDSVDGHINRGLEWRDRGFASIALDVRFVSP